VQDDDFTAALHRRQLSRNLFLKAFFLSRNKKIVENFFVIFEAKEDNTQQPQRCPKNKKTN